MNLGNARLNDYEIALKFLDAILLVQPGNHQAKNLKEEITRRMNREGCMWILALYKTHILFFLFIFRYWYRHCCRRRSTCCWR